MGSERAIRSCWGQHRAVFKVVAPGTAPATQGQLENLWDPRQNENSPSLPPHGPPPQPQWRTDSSQRGLFSPPPPQPLVFRRVGDAVLLPAEGGDSHYHAHLRGWGEPRVVGVQGCGVGQEGQGWVGPGHSQAGRPGGDGAGPRVSGSSQPPECTLFSLDFIYESQIQR